MPTRSRILFSQGVRLVAALPFCLLGFACFGYLALFTTVVIAFASLVALGTVSAVLGYQELLSPLLIYAVLAAAPVISGYWYWRRIRENYQEAAAAFLETTRAPADPRERRARREIKRLCQQAGHPAPAVRIHDSDRRECLTVERPQSVAFEDGTAADTATAIVVSSSVCALLSDRELRAVLAHEVAHLTNWDLPLVRFLLAPLTVEQSGWKYDIAALVLIGPPLLVMRAVISVGAALFLPGREFAADYGGARLTGDPAALASALDRLDGGPTRPDEDLRVLQSLNVVPASHHGRFVSRHSHPSTAARVQRLRSMVVEQVEE